MPILHLILLKRLDYYFFNVDHVKVSIEFVIILFLFYVLVSGHKACRLLAPRPEMEPTPSALEGLVSLNHCDRDGVKGQSR